MNRPRLKTKLIVVLRAGVGERPRPGGLLAPAGVLLGALPAGTAFGVQRRAASAGPGGGPARPARAEGGRRLPRRRQAPDSGLWAVADMRGGPAPPRPEAKVSSPWLVANLFWFP